MPYLPYYIVRKFLIWRKNIMRVLVSWQKVKNINLKEKIMLVLVSWRKVKKITSDKIRGGGGGGAKIWIILFCFWLRLSCYALSLPSSPSHFPSYLTLLSLADIFSKERGRLSMKHCWCWHLNTELIHKKSKLTTQLGIRPVKKDS